MCVEARDVVEAGFVGECEGGIFEQHTIDMLVSPSTYTRSKSYFQKGYPNDDPTTLVGMPSASRMAERSWDPRPARRRHISVDSLVTGTPSHSSCRAVLIISLARAVRSALSSGEKSLNFSGNVPDWLTKVELGPMISGNI